MPAVIRLLHGGAKTGILVVTGATLDGSIFLDDGGITFATTRRAGSKDALPEHDRRNSPDVAPDDMIADVIARLTRISDGTFAFEAGVQPVHEVTETYPVETILALVDERIAVWSDIIRAIGSTEIPYTMADALDPDEQVALNGHQWNALAALGGGRSVTDLSLHLQMPELETAEMMMHLKGDGLIEEGRVIEQTAGAQRGGARMFEPDRSDLVVNITDMANTVNAPGAGDDEPVSDLAARWRDLRTAIRDEVPSSG